MFELIFQILGFAALSLSLAVSVMFAGTSPESISVYSPIPTQIRLVIDPGHGGEDGGAISPLGTPESQINLDVALKMEQALAFYGFIPELLRNEDISLHDSSAETLLEKKASDLKNRVSEIERTGNTVLVSIHQNSYPDPRYHGAQVFFARTEGSRELAEHIQKTITASIQPDNSRQAKEIPSSIYLMNHITCPAVLVECGFLTNEREAELLQNSIYQKKFALTLSNAILTGLDSIAQAVVY